MGVQVRSQPQDEDLVRLYLDNIGKYALLSTEDEWQLSKVIQEGLEAKDELARGEAKGTRERSSSSWSRRVRRRRAVHQRQPPVGRIDRQKVPVHRITAIGPDPGGEPRPDARGDQVRLAPGLQVLDLRHLVGQAGDKPRDRQHGPHDQAAGPCWRPGAPADTDKTPARRANGPRPQPGRAGGALGMNEHQVAELLRQGTETVSLDARVGPDGESELGDMVADATSPSPFDLVSEAMLEERA